MEAKIGSVVKIRGSKYTFVSASESGRVLCFRGGRGKEYTACESAVYPGLYHFIVMSGYRARFIEALAIVEGEITVVCEATYIREFKKSASV